MLIRLSTWDAHNRITEFDLTAAHRIAALHEEFRART